MKRKDNWQFRGAFGISVTAIGVLLALALLFYKERTMFADASWVFVNLLHQKSFLFMEYRWGAFIPQATILSGVFLGLPMKPLLVIFSISFYLFYIIAAIVMGLRWRQPQFTVLLVLYLTLFVSDGFFCTMGEIFQGVTWMFLFLALYFRPDFRPRIYHHILLAGFAFLAIICHMIMMLPFVFLWLYLNLDRTPVSRLIRQRGFWLYSALIVLFGLARYYVSNASWYDSAKLEPLHSLNFKLVLKAFRSAQVHSFWNNVVTNYWLIVPIALIGAVLLLRSRKYLQLALIVVFSTVYIGLVGVVYPDGYGRDMLFYFENEWAPLSIILSTSFVIELFNRVRGNDFKISVVFGTIICVRLVYIYASCLFFHQRFLNLERVVDILHHEQANKVLIRVDDQAVRDYFVMGWGAPCESIMLSGLKELRPAVTFKFVPVSFAAAQVGDSFHTSFDIRAHTFLNEKYFRFDTTRNYELFDGFERFGLQDLRVRKF